MVKTHMPPEGRSRAIEAPEHTGEWLDQPDVSPRDVGANLRDLERVNRWLGGAHAVLAHVAPVLAAWDTRAVRVLDIACGGGDILRAIARRARRRGRAITAIGADRNPLVIANARANSADLPELTWVQTDARRLPFTPRSFDLVICSCFLHHLAPDQAVGLLQQAADLSRGWLIVADLVRSAPAIWSLPVLGAVLRWHPMTRHDAGVSLRRAYSPSELRALAADADLAGARVYAHLFYRMALVWRCPDTSPQATGEH